MTAKVTKCFGLLPGKTLATTVLPVVGFKDQLRRMLLVERRLKDEKTGRQTTKKQKQKNNNKKRERKDFCSLRPLQIENAAGVTRQVS